MYSRSLFLFAFFSVLILCTSVPVSAGTRPSLGFELDALPYLTGGWYGSCWMGRDGLRARMVVSDIFVPDFTVQKGFQDSRTKAFALILDRFFGADSKIFAGPWMGAGVEYWDNSIRRKGFSERADYTQRVATFGGGYVWRVHGGITLNPWAAAHARIGGAERVTTSGAVYRPARFLAEASIKLGWSF